MAEDNAVKLKAMRENYIKTFDTEEGKKVLLDLASVCRFKEPTFNKDPYITAFQEGLRAVYLHIITIREMDIEQLEAFSAVQK